MYAEVKRLAAEWNVAQGVPTAATHLTLLLEATAYSLEVRTPPVAPVPAAAFPAVPLRLLHGTAAPPGVVQEVTHWVGLQYAFLWVHRAGGWQAHWPRRPCPTWDTLALTRWLRSYSAIFSISSFIFSMFCLRRSSHSWGTERHQTSGSHSALLCRKVNMASLSLFSDQLALKAGPWLGSRNLAPSVLPVNSELIRGAYCALTVYGNKVYTDHLLSFWGREIECVPGIGDPCVQPPIKTLGTKSLMHPWYDPSHLAMTPCWKN